MGNAARFANDCWCRDQPKSVNLDAEFRWHVVGDIGFPVVFLIANRTIDKGAELVNDYGLSYWRIVWKRLQRDHTEYWVSVNLR
jgi:hypothetical protein